jgi:DNA-binding NarL/FixJ family response regulator
VSTPHFLASAATPTPITPPERWLQAFPQGQWSNWHTLLAALQPGDTVWVPVAHADWLDKVAALRQAQPDCHVVVVSLLPYDAEGLRAVNAGAHGYCHQMAVPELLREVAEVVQHGGLWLGPELVQRMVLATRELLARSPRAELPRTDLSVLSERELQVARAVAEGKSNKEVADLLHISERTVKAHLGAVFEKLGVRDRVQLVLHVTQASANPP